MDAIPLYDASTPMADDHQEEQDSRDNNNNSSGEQNSEPKEQNLLSLANTCSKKLSALWERTGISPEQRQAKLQQLLGDISAVYQAQISAEETRRNALLETLGAKTASLVQLCARLEIDHEEFCKRKEDERMEALETGSNASNISDLMDEPTLHEQIAAIEEHRQELGEMQEVKGKEARELLSQVFALWDRLGTPLNEPVRIPLCI